MKEYILKMQRENDLIEYLEVNAKHFNLINKGKKYMSMYHFVLKYGSMQREIKPYSQDNIGKPKECFSNSMKFIATKELLRNEKFFYCEGFCFSQIIPIHHAWVVDKKNRVIETTLKENAYAYYGVRFPLWYIRKNISKNKYFSSVIENYKSDFPLLTGNHKYEDIEKNRIDLIKF
jgi:hypothetical protein